MEKTLQIEKLVLEGSGLSRGGPGEKVAFVPYVCPGERVKARRIRQTKNLDQWLPVQILQPSKERTSPRCSVFFRPGTASDWCGGCDWQHLTVESALDNKTRLVAETLERIGGLKNPPMEPPISSPSPWRYRNKALAPFRFQGKKASAGFYAPGTHRVVPFDDCHIQPDIVTDLIHFLQDMAIRFKWRPYDEDRGTGWLRHFYVRSNRQGEVMACLVTKDGRFPGSRAFVDLVRERFPSVVSLFHNIQPRKTNVVLGNRWIKLWGKERLSEMIDGMEISFSPASFFQVNPAAAERLFRRAIDEGELSQQDFLLDLYCGVGIFSLLGAKKVRSAMGVEIVPSAVRDAVFNARANRVHNVRFFEGSAERFLETEAGRRALERARQLVAYVDPPRSGLDPRLVQTLLRLNPKRIIYVSCNPATFARDAKELLKTYRLSKVIPVDLFPQTSHVELIGRFDLP